MTLRIYLRVSDPAERRRVGDLLRKDPEVVLVADADEADLLVDDAGPARPVGGATVSDAGELLTPREREVLRLMADGLGNKGIGTALGISAHTAKYHVAAVLAKLDAQSRTEAVTKGLREGLLPL
jgi:two-component system nitrate/nitrite response regulator NarL